MIDTANAPVASVATGIRQILPGDVDGLAKLLSNVWRVREVWTDEALANPAAWFMNHYTDPNSLVFDIADGGGFIAFLHTVPGWYTTVYLGAWERRAMRRVDLWRAATSVAMLAHGLLVANAFILPSNRLSLKLARACGMRERGLIRVGASYNGAPSPWVWFDIDRRELGLSEITLDDTQGGT